VKKLKLKKLIASSLIVVSVLALNSIGASASWKQDNVGWWNTEGSSYSTGWRTIDGKWYYFNSNGYMAHDTIIDGYKLGSDGAWVVTTPIASTTTGNTTVDKTTGIYYWGRDIQHMNYQDYYDNIAGTYSYGYSNSDKKVYDNLNNEYTNYLTLCLYTGYSYNSDPCYGYIEFPLNGEFKEFKSKLGLTKEYQDYFKSGKVQIYLDDEEVYNTNLKPGDMLKDVDINLTGKKKIKFYFETTGHVTKGEIGFFNGEFIK